MHTKANSSVIRTRGFSLVELSIVLVILGLLTGGILAGQSLIRAAELRSVTADLSRYQAAVMSFRDKYMAYPGDMPNATRFWGVRAGTGSDVTCHQTIATTTGTCNGDGDGGAGTISGDSTFGERFLTWQHLAYAGLIEGSYTGASGNASAEVRITGTNIPRSKISNAYFYVFWLGGSISGSAHWFDGTYNVQVLSLQSQVLSPEEAWNVDTKMDDGRPAYGRIWNLKSTSTWSLGCTTTDAVSTSEYALTNTSKLCNLHYNIW